MSGTKKTKNPRTLKGIAGRWLKLPGLGGSIRIAKAHGNPVEWRPPRRKNAKKAKAKKATRRK